MTALEAHSHYSAHDIEARILAALRAAGMDPDRRLSPVDLGALDHFHTGGFRASLALKELAQIRAEDRVLDLGAGLAGPARMLAGAPGCHVDCIELSADYCVGARLLNRLTALEGCIDIHEGSVLALPFPDDSFDVVWMQNVGMNIADKRRLYGEVYRVLKPDGRFAFQEIAAGEGPVTCFPLPWATSEAESFLISIDGMRVALNQCGLVAEYFEDVSDVQLGASANGTTESGGRTPLSLSVYVDNLAQKAENAARSLREHQIRLVRGVFRAK